MDYYDEWNEQGPVDRPRRATDSVRIHLSIPRALRERMQETPGISWSRVAARAFRRALEIEAQLAGAEGRKEARALKPGGGQKGRAE